MVTYLTRRAVSIGSTVASRGNGADAIYATSIASRTVAVRSTTCRATGIVAAGATGRTVAVKAAEAWRNNAGTAGTDLTRDTVGSLGTSGSPGNADLILNVAAAIGRTVGITGTWIGHICITNASGKVARLSGETVVINIALLRSNVLAHVEETVTSKSSRTVLVFAASEGTSEQAIDGVGIAVQSCGTVNIGSAVWRQDGTETSGAAGLSRWALGVDEAILRGGSAETETGIANLPRGAVTCLDAPSWRNCQAGTRRRVAGQAARAVASR